MGAAKGVAEVEIDVGPMGGDEINILRLGRNYTVGDLPSGLQGLANETTGAPFEEDLYFGKIDYTPDENQLWELSVKYRTENELTMPVSGPGSGSAATGPASGTGSLHAPHR